MDRKVVFFDIDGTLLDGDGIIPESAKKALRKLKEKGHLRFICTGRPFCTIEDKLLELEFDGIICGAGTHLIYDGKEIFYQRIGQKEVDYTLDVLNKYNMNFIFEGKSNIYVTKEVKEQYLESEGFGDFIRRVEAFSMMLEDAKDISISKFTCNFDSENMQYKEFILDELKELYTPIIHDSVIFEGVDSRSEVQFAEFVPKGVNKAEGIKKTIEYLKLPWKSTIAFGDSNNDLEMLEYVNYSVAMGKCSNKAREVSDYVTDEVQDDGIYKALKKLELI